jgi:hypothetical protein
VDLDRRACPTWCLVLVGWAGDAGAGIATLGRTLFKAFLVAPLVFSHILPYCPFLLAGGNNHRSATYTTGILHLVKLASVLPFRDFSLKLFSGFLQVGYLRKPFPDKFRDQHMVFIGRLFQL